MPLPKKPSLALALLCAACGAHTSLCAACGALTLLCAACGGSLPLPTASTSSCSTPAQVTFVRDTLQDIYFWYQNLPNPDPATFSSPEA